MTNTCPKVELEKAEALYSSVLPDVGDDRLFPDIALDGLDSEYELVDKVETAVSCSSNGKTNAQDC